jgi:hypothetical protein
MLQNLSLEVRECMERARECAERAKVEPDPLVQRNYLDLELPLGPVGAQLAVF